MSIVTIKAEAKRLEDELKRINERITLIENKSHNAVVVYDCYDYECSEILVIGDCIISKYGMNIKVTDIVRNEDGVAIQVKGILPDNDGNDIVESVERLSLPIHNYCG